MSEVSTPNPSQISNSQAPNIEVNVEEILKRINTVLPKSLIYKADKYTTTFPAFQVFTPGYIYKIHLYEHAYLDVIDCKSYESRSGLTFNYCVDNTGKEVKGLWVVNRNFVKITVRSNRIMFRSKSSVGFDYLPSWVNLIYVDNYGYDAYERAVKAPTLTLRKVAEQGHLEVYDFTPYFTYYKFLLRSTVYRVELEHVNELSIYNHKVTFKGQAYKMSRLIIVPEETDVVLSSDDHGQKEVRLPVGVYLFLHRPPRRAVD